MQFVFDEEKTTQAASLLLDRHGGTMPYIKLIKLLYLADRQSLIETGSPITGDRFVAMPKGPVLSRVLDLIRESDSAADSLWHSCINRSGYDATLIGAPGRDRLAEYDEKLLDRIFEAYGEENEWDLVGLTHELPEWTDPGESSCPIAPEDILRNSGFTEEQVQHVVEQADAVYSLRQHFPRLARAQ